MTSAPNLVLISSWIFWGVLQLRNREVFSRFNCWPEAISYVPRTFSRFEHYSLVARQNIRLSFAKKMCDIYGVSWSAVTPFSNPCSADCFSNADGPFAQSKNKYKERGSPWGRPLVGVTQPRDLPLILTEYVTVLTHLIIIFTHFSSNPIFCIIFS